MYINCKTVLLLEQSPSPLRCNRSSRSWGDTWHNLTHRVSGASTYTGKGACTQTYKHTAAVCSRGVTLYLTRLWRTHEITAEITFITTLSQIVERGRVLSSLFQGQVFPNLLTPATFVYSLACHDGHELYCLTTLCIYSTAVHHVRKKKKNSHCCSKKETDLR